MANESHSYQFHPDVVLRVTASSCRVLDHFDLEYGAQRVADTGVAAVDAYVGSPAPLAREAALSCRSGYKTTRWTVRAWGVEEPTTTIEMRGRGLFLLPFLQGYYVEPLLRMRLVGAGRSLTRAAAVVLQGTASLLAADSHVGKTTFAVAQAMRGVKVLGDDSVLISGDGLVQRFPRRLRIYPDLQRTCPTGFRALRPGDILALRVLGAAARLSLGYLRLPRLVPLAQFGAVMESSTPAPLSALYFLSRGSDHDIAGPTPLSTDDFVRRVCQLNYTQDAPWLALIESRLAPHAPSRDGDMSRREHAILARAFRGLPAFEIKIPHVPDPGRITAQLARAIGIDEAIVR